MTGILEKLNVQIKRARHQLLLSTRDWLSSEMGLADDLKLIWFAAVKKPSSGEMQTALRKASFPFDRLDEAVVLAVDNPELPATEFNVMRRQYQFTSPQKDIHWDKLCHLTTLFEQLHHLEELLALLKLEIPIETLESAYDAAVNISNEWCKVNTSMRTVERYRRRVFETQEDLNAAKEIGTKSSQLLAAIMSNIHMEFADTIRFLAHCLTNSYAEVKDDRLLVEFWKIRLRTYLPWQLMINNLTKSLLGEHSFSHPNINTLEIQNDCLVTLTQAVIKQAQKQNNVDFDKFQELSALTDKKLSDIGAKIDVMEKSCQARASQGVPGAIISALSAQQFTFFPFYERLCATNRITVEQVLLPAGEELEAENGLTH